MILRNMNGNPPYMKISKRCSRKVYATGTKFVFYFAFHGTV